MVGDYAYRLSDGKVWSSRRLRRYLQPREQDDQTLPNHDQEEGRHLIAIQKLQSYTGGLQEPDVLLTDTVRDNILNWRRGS